MKRYIAWISIIIVTILIVGIIIINTRDNDDTTQISTPTATTSTAE